MKTITIFTPTYNRAYCLGQLYESLLRQTNKDFCWLIIDDGSSDTTNELVQGWIAEGKIELQYLYQANQGMHGAHNTAYQNIQTPYNFCIDSDDYLPDDAIEKICNHLPAIASDNFAGLIGLDCDPTGTVIGSTIPKQWKQGGLNALYRNGVTGDKKVVLKTAIVKQFPPYPIYPGEKLVPLGTLYVQIDQKYQWLYTNDVLCVVEYLPDGSSHTIFKQYKVSPRGFGYSRLIRLQYPDTFKNHFIQAMHLVSSALFARDVKLLFQCPKPGLLLLALGPGIALHWYIRLKVK